jgi:hypothetical protein
MSDTMRATAGRGARYVPGPKCELNLGNPLVFTIDQSKKALNTFEEDSILVAVAALLRRSAKRALEHY